MNLLPSHRKHDSHVFEGETHFMNEKHVKDANADNSLPFLTQNGFLKKQPMVLKKNHPFLKQTNPPAIKKCIQNVYVFNGVTYLRKYSWVTYFSSKKTILQ